MLDQAGGQVLVKDGVRLFGEYGVYPVWTGGDRGAARGYGNLEGDKGAGTEVCLRCGEDVLELAERRRPSRRSPMVTTRNREGRT